MIQASHIIVDRRFHGPPDSGNGGYVAGLLAGALGGAPCRVMLKLPPPLERPLRIAFDGAGASLFCDDALVAIATTQDVRLDVPPAPSLDAARTAERHYAGFCGHIYPGCFVCGPERAAGDGLRIFAGPLDDDPARVATVWEPDESLSDDDGQGAALVASPFIWAALDCPGYFAVEKAAGRALLGTLEAALVRPVPVGAPLIVTGWPIATEGRKHRVGTALHDADGGLLACAIGTWISLGAR